ncbi:outer membrane protein assembly factor [Alphaproteobacteria bacterium]|nr:outer membrane protein assembly factor [Alphaproteobacteria bacterium]
MVLKKYSLTSVFLFFFAAAEDAQIIHTEITNNKSEDIPEDDDMHDFRYHVELLIKNEQNIFGEISEMFSGSEIEQDVKSLRTFSEADKTVSSMKALLDRISSDINDIHKKAHELGFYEADVKHKIKVINKGLVDVKIYIDLGKQFDLKLNLKLVGKDNAKKYQDKFERELSGAGASIAKIKSLIEDVAVALKSNGFFDPKILEKRVYLDYSNKAAILNLTIDPQKNVKFYFTEIKAFPGISTDFIRNRIVWKEGETYDIEKTKRTKEKLRDTQIFSDVSIKPMNDRVIDDKVPILMTLEEDKKHLIDFSLLYSGTKNMNFDKKSKANEKLKSIMTRASWTNYNTFGGGEKLRFTVDGTPMKVKSKRSDYSFEVALTQPDLIAANNTAEYILSRRQELTNVFFKKSDKASLMLFYPLSSVTSMQVGCDLERNYIDLEESHPDFDEIFFPKLNEKTDVNKKYNDIKFPLEFIFDNRDVPLNPTEGYRASVKICRMQLHNAAVGHLHNLDLGFSYNYAIDELKKTIFSFHVSQKNIIGGKIDDIPLDKRLYAGGMNSVRGYANQMAAEMITCEYEKQANDEEQTDNKEIITLPMGGKSLLEFNTEIRRKINADFGAVAFFDGAKIFQNRSRRDELKIEAKRWFFSAGFGACYYTSIGPIRVDLAFPLKKRKEDSKMQFYISLGHAF